MFNSRDAVGRHQDQVGEGAPHVHSQPVAHADLPKPASPAKPELSANASRSPRP